MQNNEMNKYLNYFLQRYPNATVGQFAKALPAIKKIVQKIRYNNPDYYYVL